MISILLPFFLICFFLYILYFGFFRNYIENYRSIVKVEGFSDAEQNMVYLPDPKSGVAREIKIGEWVKESQMIMGFLKVDNKLMKEASNDRTAFEQYRAEPTSLEGYKITSSYETNDDILTKKYGEFFTGNSWPNKLAKPVEFEEFKRKWIEVCLPVSTIYSKTYRYFRIKNEIRKTDMSLNNSYFASVFFDWMNECHESSQDKLDKAKTVFYDIVRPQEVQTSMIDNFVNNAKYANMDEALYILNTTEDFLAKIDTSKIPNKDGYIHADGIQSDIHVGYIAMYQVNTLLFGIVDWMRKVESLKTNMMKTTPETFYAGFHGYVKLTKPQLSKKDLYSYYIFDNMPVGIST